MALRSALGLHPENPVSFTGKCYQALIRRGFSQGKNFISVSDKTREDLEGFLQKKPALSVYIHNGLNYPFSPLDVRVAEAIWQQEGLDISKTGFLLHVGGNQWYKNREGVLIIYHAYCQTTDQPLPLYLIGMKPTDALRERVHQLPVGGQVIFLTGVSTTAIHAAYSLATALIFPSIAEGFGWPIAEAMACGCPVLTTNEAPMTEVGGDAAIYLPVMPSTGGTVEWAKKCADILIQAVLSLSDDKKEERYKQGLQQAKRFSTDITLNGYEVIYSQILNSEK
jgi:glycosyltransferase involved in cell wall biosynthesis